MIPASVITDGEDGNGLKLEDISQLFSSSQLKLCLEKIAKNIMSCSQVGLEAKVTCPDCSKNMSLYRACIK